MTRDDLPSFLRKPTRMQAQAAIIRAQVKPPMKHPSELSDDDLKAWVLFMAAQRGPEWSGELEMGLWVLRQRGSE